MKLVCQLVALLACSNAIAQMSPIDERWITVSYPLKWKAPPREIGSKVKTAEADIMVLYPSGEFAEILSNAVAVSERRTLNELLE